MTTEGPRPIVALGRVAKPHGLRGELIVELWTDQPERTQVGARWTIAGADYELTAVQPYQKRWLVKLSGIGRREEAEALAGEEVSAEALERDDVLWVHELVGLPVVDQREGPLGEVGSVVANPASDLLDLGGNVLIPLTYVTEVKAGDRIEVDVPEGLLEILGWERP